MSSPSGRPSEPGSHRIENWCQAIVDQVPSQLESQRQALAELDEKRARLQGEMRANEELLAVAGRYAKSSHVERPGPRQLQVVGAS